MTGEWVIVALVMWVAPVVVSSMLGTRKGRRYGHFYGILLGWIGVLVLAMRGDIEDQKGVLTGRKTCPDCAEQVQAAARVCKHCGHRFDAVAILE